MATSDSEDFESADEWDDGCDAVSEKIAMSNVSVKACLGDSSISDDKSRAIVSGNDDSADVETVAKSMEKDVKIQETKSTKNYVCMQEGQSDIKVFSNTSKLSEGDDVKVCEIFTKVDVTHVDHEEVTIGKLQGESDVTTVIDDIRVEDSDIHVQELTKEDMMKFFETCAKKAGDSVLIKVETVTVLDRASVEVHSKEDNSNLNVAVSLNPDTGTDGWDDSADVEKVAKSMEKDVNIQETKSTENYVCMQEGQSDIKVFCNTSKLSEGVNVKVFEILTEVDDIHVDHEEVLIGKLQDESDITTVVDDIRVEDSDIHVQELTKEDMMKIFENCAEKADDSVVFKVKTLTVLDHASVEVHSKEDNSNLNVAVSLDPDTGTDGWDCEDYDLNEQVIEESIIKDTVSALNQLSESDDNEKKNSDSSTSNTWSSWGSWGVTSILSTATESVSTITSHVSQGLSTVLETGLGVPDPEELAKQKAEEERKILSSVESDSTLEVEEHEEKSDGNTGFFGFGRVISGVSSITKLVETAGTKVVSGGLGTLENIGKKTMEVLQEGDPGLRKKRALFSDKVVLSQVLREAKEKAELEDEAVRNTQAARKVHFEMLFDDYHGLVHLEALEMLSKQCNIKLQSVLLNTTPSDVPELQESIAEIKDLCQLPDDDDEVEGVSFETLEARLGEVGKGLGVPVANEKLVKTWQEIHLWLQECRNKQMFSKKEAGDNEDKSPPTAREIHQKAIGTLARLTAEAVEQFHKTAELLLVYEKRNPFQEAKILLEMTSVFSLEVSTAATVFSENLNTCSEYSENREAVNSDITNVFLEAANSSSYIQEAFQLLIPVLQVGAVSL